jgi:Mg-chelatase subunit ChlD
MNLRNKKKEVEKVTQAIFVIDESGSMASCANETISGINEQIQELKKEKDVKTFATLVTFSGTIRDRLVNQPVDELDELDSSSYEPNGSTVLYDAVAHALLREENRKYETKDVSRLLIIVTDGEENSSKEFSIYNGGAAKISEMIKRVQKEGWTVTYLNESESITNASLDSNDDNESSES